MKKPEVPQASILGCTVNNTAAPCSPEQAKALEELARAATALAVAISDIAKSLKGTEAHMKYGIALGLDDERN